MAGRSTSKAGTESKASQKPSTNQPSTHANVDTTDSAPKHGANTTTAKKLYEGPRDREGYQTWLDEPPQEMAEIAARKSQRKAHPLVLRYVKTVDDSGDKIFRLHSLVIQSEVLYDFHLLPLRRFDPMNLY